MKVDRQKPIDIAYQQRQYATAFRIDLLVNDWLILEAKSVERLSKAHGKQLLTHLRLGGQPVGLLLNFAGATMKENDYRQPPGTSASLPESSQRRIRCSTCTE